jgi:outer membrane lipoprotein SlyB
MNVSNELRNISETYYAVGAGVGSLVGLNVGGGVGALVGRNVGAWVGFLVGILVGALVGGEPLQQKIRKRRRKKFCIDQHAFAN